MLAIYNIGLFYIRALYFFIKIIHFDIFKLLLRKTDAMKWNFLSSKVPQGYIVHTNSMIHLWAFLSTVHFVGVIFRFRRIPISIVWALRLSRIGTFSVMIPKNINDNRTRTYLAHESAVYDAVRFCAITLILRWGYTLWVKKKANANVRLKLGRCIRCNDWKRNFR